MQGKTSYTIIVGAIIGHLRKKKGLGQKDIAEKLDITQSAWSKLERGDTCLSITQLNQISQILEIPANRILRHAEKAQEKLKKENIEVLDKPLSQPNDKALFILGVAVVSVIIIAILSKE